MLKLRFKYLSDRRITYPEDVLGLTFSDYGEIAVTTKSGNIYSITQDNGNINKLLIVDMNGLLVPADTIFQVLGIN